MNTQLGLGLGLNTHEHPYIQVMPLSTGLASHIAATLEVCLVSDAYTDWRFDPGLEQVSSR